MVIYIEDTLTFLSKTGSKKVDRLIPLGEIKSIKDNQIRYLKIK